MPIAIYSKFESGSLQEWHAEDGVICLTPAGGDESPWFYFLISFVAGQEVTFRVPALAGKAGWPVSISYDRLDWVPADRIGEGPVFRHRFRADDALVSLTPPYTNGMLYDLTLWAQRSPHAGIEYLSNEAPPGSEPLTCITISEMGDSAGKPSVWLIAREQPAEAAASWLAEGAVRFLLSPDPLAQALRRRYVFKIIPMLDIMGVHAGNTEASLQWGRMAEADTPDPTGLLSRLLVKDSIGGGPVALVLSLRSRLWGEANRCAISGRPGGEAWLPQARELLPWYMWQETPAAPGALGQHLATICPGVSVGEVETSWYYSRRSVGGPDDVRKSQYDLLQEGECLLRALAGYLQMERVAGLPPLLGPRLAGDGESASATVFSPAAEAGQVYLAGPGYEKALAPAGALAPGGYMRYTLTVPAAEAVHAEYITLKSDRGFRRITLAERQSRQCDASLL